MTYQAHSHSQVWKLLKSSRDVLLLALERAGANVDSLDKIICPFCRDEQGTIRVFPYQSFWMWSCSRCRITGNLAHVVENADHVSHETARRRAVQTYVAMLKFYALDKNTRYPTEIELIHILEHVLHAKYTHQDDFTENGHALPRMSFLHFRDEFDLELIRPIHPRADGWSVGSIREGRPIFNLNRISNRVTDDVYVVETTDDVRALESIGLLATTCAYAERPERSDWLPLCGRTVVVFPSFGPAGDKFRDDIVAILKSLWPSPSVVVLAPESLGIRLDREMRVATMIQMITGSVAAHHVDETCVE